MTVPAGIEKPVETEHWDDGLVHIWIDDPDRSLCGIDITGLERLPANESAADCPLCVEAETDYYRSAS